MKIAVTYEAGNVFQHFGHSSQFKVYTVENHAVTHSEVVDTLGSGHGALANMLANLQVDTLICGGIGAGAQTALAQAGIHLYGGVSGNADKAVKALLEGKLSYNPDVHCNHHAHDHVHDCGSHSCGEDKHGCAGKVDAKNKAHCLKQAMCLVFCVLFHDHEQSASANQHTPDNRFPTDRFMENNKGQYNGQHHAELVNGYNLGYVANLYRMIIA